VAQVDFESFTRPSSAFLPIHVNRYRIWRANISDKTGSEMTAEFDHGHRHATLAGQGTSWAAPDAVSFGEGRQWPRQPDATVRRQTGQGNHVAQVDHEKFHKYVTKFHFLPQSCESVIHLESQYLL
jgi:hypothetical protein